MMAINEDELNISDVNGVSLKLPKLDREQKGIIDFLKSFTTEELQELHILIAREIIERAVA